MKEEGGGGGGGGGLEEEGEEQKEEEMRERERKEYQKRAKAPALHLLQLIGLPGSARNRIIQRQNKRYQKCCNSNPRQTGGIQKHRSSNQDGGFPALSFDQHACFINHICRAVVLPHDGTVYIRTARQLDV